MTTFNPKLPSFNPAVQVPLQTNNLASNTSSFNDLLSQTTKATNTASMPIKHDTSLYQFGSQEPSHFRISGAHHTTDFCLVFYHCRHRAGCLCFCARHGRVAGCRLSRSSIFGQDVRDISRQYNHQSAEEYS